MPCPELGASAAVVPDAALITGGSFAKTSLSTDNKSSMFDFCLTLLASVPFGLNGLSYNEMETCTETCTELTVAIASSIMPGDSFLAVEQKLAITYIPMI